MRPAIISMQMPRALPVSQIMGSPRRNDLARVRHQMARYRSRRRWRISSATVLTRKVMRKRTRPARKSVAVERAPVGRLGDLHRDVGGERAHAVEDRPVEHRRVAGGHEHDHGLAHRAAEADHDRGEDAGAGGGQHHADRGLPAAGPQGQRGRGQVLGHAREASSAIVKMMGMTAKPMARPTTRQLRWS